MACGDVPFGASMAVTVQSGGWSHTIGKLCGTIPMMMEIQGADIAPGAGNVLVAGDVLFSDYFVFPGFGGGQACLRNVNNATILKNFVAQQIIPEPSSLLVWGGIGALGLIGVALRRRRGVRCNPSE